MDNKEIRRKILEVLYEFDEEDPSGYIGREVLKEKLGIDDKKLDSNILYLEQKSYIELLKGMGAIFFSARIKCYGKDLVENKEEFNSMFPVNITQNVITNSIGVAIGNNNPINITIEDSFKKIYDDVQKQDVPNKEEIIKNVKEIEDEIKKDNKDKNIIMKSIDFLKTNAGQIASIIEMIAKVKSIFQL